MKAFLQFLRAEYDKCMTQPEYNSRVIYLVSGIGHVVAMGAVIAAFIFAKDKSGYDGVIMALSGSGLSAGIAKWMQKSAQAKMPEPPLNITMQAPPLHVPSIEETEMEPHVGG